MATNPETLSSEEDRGHHLTSENNSLNNNEDDLEQYGVWVKVGPEDVEEEPPAEDFELESLQPDMGESEGLTEEEEQLRVDWLKAFFDFSAYLDRDFDEKERVLRKGRHG